MMMMMTCLWFQDLLIKRMQPTHPQLHHPPLHLVQLIRLPSTLTLNHLLHLPPALLQFMHPQLKQLQFEHLQLKYLHLQHLQLGHLQLQQL